MHPPSADAVRLLAAWQQRRRALTDRLDGLLLHGPTAVDRVVARAQELREALEDERAAFEAFVVGVHEAGRREAPPTPRVEERQPVYPPLRAVPSDA